MAVSSVVVALLVTYACSIGQGQGQVDYSYPRPPQYDSARPETFTETITANDKIALKLLKSLSQRTPSGNLIFSPVSIHIATGMLAEGAEGKTAEQLRRFLEIYTGSRKPGYEKITRLLRSTGKYNTLKSANALFLRGDIPVKLNYSQTITGNIFKSELVEMNFNFPEYAANLINTWVSHVTEDSLSPDTKMVIGNAIYFKGKWEHPFPTGLTRQDKFFSLFGETPVNMMRQQGYFPFKNIAELDCTIMELPYGENEYVMDIILPNGVTNLATFSQELSKFNLGQLLSPGKMTEVDVFLPRFNIETAESLTNILKEVGVTDVFGRQADLSGISHHGLSVSEIFHKAIVQVSEEGTVAAAATGVYIVPLTGFLNPEKFRADRPFIYCIRHAQSNLLLFVGQVNDPGLVGPPAREASYHGRPVQPSVHEATTQGNRKGPVGPPVQMTHSPLPPSVTTSKAPEAPFTVSERQQEAITQDPNGWQNNNNRDILFPEGNVRESIIRNLKRQHSVVFDLDKEIIRRK